MTPSPMGGPETFARIEIDTALEAAGWCVQSRSEINLSASRGVAIREFKLKSGHGYADYLRVRPLERIPNGWPRRSRRA